ncbi:hypothetical protein FGO68_gene131 [Halteria grandinella]|uniref:Lysozyme n=1 Tax=Halteria grandinella TaxID=5974 RepID=A0A8J8P9P1_HALGN|nr:hypothetical protein FGO68_gene131 [Halteria grandinella]
MCLADPAQLSNWSYSAEPSSSDQRILQGVGNVQTRNGVIINVSKLEALTKLGEGGPYLTAYPDKCPPYLKKKVCTQDLIDRSVWTIGYGHTGFVDGVKVAKGMQITAKQAGDLLLLDSADAIGCIKRNYLKFRLNPNQNAALADFIINFGCSGSMFQDKIPRDWYKRLKAGEKDVNKIVTEEWPKLLMAGEDIMGGLLTRRKLQIEVFTTPYP